MAAWLFVIALSLSGPLQPCPGPVFACWQWGDSLQAMPERPLIFADGFESGDLCAWKALE